MSEKLAIIGAGNMGGAIRIGLLENNVFSIEQIILTNSKTLNNSEAARKAGIVALTVKPTVLESVLKEIGDSCTGDLIISFVAGKSMDFIAEKLGDGQSHHIVRVMSNLGAREGEAMSTWVANEHVTESEKDVVREILSSIGKEMEVDNEDLIDVATAISGSGPGTISFYLEAMVEAGVRLGLSKGQALEQVRQTLIGTAELLKHTYEDPASLRRDVTSPNGTTFAEVKRLQTDMVDRGIIASIFAGHRRARELGSS